MNFTPGENTILQSTEATVLQSRNEPSKFGTFLLNAVFVLSLFPFFKIIPFIDAEVQPFAAIFAFIYVLTNLNIFPKYLTTSIIPYIFILFGYFGISMLLVFHRDLQIQHLLESFIIFLVPLMCFIALAGNLKERISVRAFKYSVLAWFSMSFFQLLLPSVLDATGISLLMSIFIARFSGEVLSDAGGRGVVGFSPEPSYGAQIVVLMLIYAIYLYRNQSLNRKEFNFILFEIAFMIFANRSGSILLMLAVFFIPYFFLRSFKGIKFLLNSILSILGIVLIYQYALLSFPELAELRMFQFVSDLASAFAGGNASIMDFENSQGSLRNVGIQTGYLNILRTIGLGSGMGGWGSYMLIAMEDVGFRISEISYFTSDSSLILNKKPFAYAALLAFDTGAIGLYGLTSILFQSFVHKLKELKMKNQKRLSPFSIACLCYSLLGLFYNSPASLPVAWIVFLIFMES